MFGRFDASARHALVRAELIARDRAAATITVEHLLDAVRWQGDAGGTPAIDATALPPRQPMTTEPGLPSYVEATRIPFDADCIGCIDAAGAIALEERSGEVGAEHLFVALLRSDTTAGRTLRDAGCDPDRSATSWRDENWEREPRPTRRAMRAMGRRMAWRSMTRRNADLILLAVVGVLFAVMAVVLSQPFR